MAAGDYQVRDTLHFPFLIPLTAMVRARAGGEIAAASLHGCTHIIDIFSVFPAASHPSLHQLLAIVGHACPI